MDDIIADMEGYSRNIDILMENRDNELAEKETLSFNNYLEQFGRFFKTNGILDELDTPVEPETLPEPEPVSDSMTAAEVSEEPIPEDSASPQN